jgi:hypothetical protein
MNTKITRTQLELVTRLQEHCEILEDYHQKACREGQTKYLGEIAGKLRLLVYQSRMNRPLLLDLMTETGSDVSFTIDSPHGQYNSDLHSYLSDMACAIRLSSGELAVLSKYDLIALWSQQSGSAHEDWALDERLSTIFAQGLFVNGQPIQGAALCGICRTVLHVAKQFLSQVTQNNDNDSAGNAGR